jgi:CRP-like cAMP-binding protein
MPLKEYVSLLTRVPLFSGVPPAHLQALVFSAPRRTFRPGEWIIRKGERDEAGWLLLAGAATAHDAPADAEEEVLETSCVARLSRGAFIGEAAMVAGLPHRLSVRAETSVSALCLPRDLFLRACSEFPEFGRRVLDNALARFSHAMSDLEEVRRIFENARSFSAGD